MKSNKYWFKPKIYGYGAYPITWEGWLLVFGFFGLVLLVATYLISMPMLFFPSMGVLIALLVVISYKKTDGEWKWRWGEIETEKKK